MSLNTASKPTKKIMMIFEQAHIPDSLSKVFAENCQVSFLQVDSVTDLH